MGSSEVAPRRKKARDSTGPASTNARGMRQPRGGRGVLRLAHRALLVIAGLAALGLLPLTVGVARLSTPELARPSDAVSGLSVRPGDHAGRGADDPVLTELEGTLREQGIAAAQQRL